MKKHIPPFLLAVWPYLFFALSLLIERILPELSQRYPAAEDLIVSYGSAVFWISLLVLLVGNVIYALRCKSLTAAELARWDFIIKLCHIPVYVLLFLFALLMVLAIAVPAVLMMVIVLVPTIFVFDLVMMLTSSCYGFRALRMAKQEGLVEKKWARNHIIAHCFFVADVISAFFVWKKLKRHPDRDEICGRKIVVSAERSPDAEVVFAFNGVRRTPARSGYCPAHDLGNGQLMGGIHHYDGVEELAPDGTARGTITFFSPEDAPASLWEGMVIPIREGERVVGHATVEKVLNPAMERK